MKQLSLLTIALVLTASSFASNEVTSEIQKNVKKNQLLLQPDVSDPISCGIGSSSVSGTCWELTVTTTYCCVCTQIEANVGAMFAARNEIRNIIRNNLELLEMLEELCN